MALGPLISVALTNTHKFYVAKSHSDTWTNPPPKVSYLAQGPSLGSTLNMYPKFFTGVNGRLGTLVVMAEAHCNQPKQARPLCESTRCHPHVIL